MKKGANVGLVFIFPLRVCMRYMVRLHFPFSNNVAEYEALINGLRVAIELGIRGNSQLVIDQVMKSQAATMLRWLRIAEKSASWRTSLMVSSSITSRGVSMRRPMRWRKRHPAKIQCRQASSPAISTNPRFAMRSQNKSVMALLPWARGLTSHRLHPTPKSWSLTRIQR